MAIVKKRNEQTETRLLLESEEPIDLPPAEVDEKGLIVQFDKDKPYINELLETLREGTRAELVPVMRDGSTFALHTNTRTFWVKMWHAAGSDLTKVERVQVLSCLPSTRGVRLITDDDFVDEEDDFTEDED